MNRKFGRSFVLQVDSLESGGDTPRTLEITDPFTVEFTVRRAMLSQAQTATIRLYNLNPTTRDKLFKDQNTVPVAANGDTIILKVKLWAGYGSFRPLIFNGMLRYCYSEREGSNYVTTIEANDSLTTADSFSNVTFSTPVKFEDLVKTLAKDLKGVTGAPIVGEFPTATETSRGIVLTGNTWGLINTYTHGRATIDNGQLKVLFDGQAIVGGIPVLTSDSGLLGTPRRGNARIEVKMLFEPRFTLGQQVLLQSDSWKTVNRVYQVAGFTHRGTISAAVSGECFTDLILYGPSQFKIVRGEAVMQ